MTNQDRQQIDELFQQLRQMADDATPRDPEAAAAIRGHLQRQPAAAYYMTQLLLLQKESLANAKARLDRAKRQQSSNVSNAVSRPAPHAEGSGQSFLADAAQTALGVGGGLLLADFVAGLFGAAFSHDTEVDYSNAGNFEAVNDESVSNGETDLFGLEQVDTDWGLGDGDGWF